MDDNVKRLEARIADLESKLASAGRPQPTEITADEMKAYRKVRDVMAADWGDFCGINDCYRCIIQPCTSPVCVVRCIVRCINECVCGPCNLCAGPLGGGGGGQFGGFGG